MKKLRFSGVAVAMILFLTVGAFAAPTNQTLSAMFNRGITITCNGEAQSLHGVSGDPVYSIAHNATRKVALSCIGRLKTPACTSPHSHKPGEV